MTAAMSGTALRAVAALSAIGALGPVNVAGAASAALPCTEFTALQVANRSLLKISDLDVAAQRDARVASFRSIVASEKSAEAKLTAGDKKLMAAIRAADEERLAAVAKEPSGVKQVEALVRLSIRSDKATAALNAGAKLYPRVDKACGTKLSLP